MNCDLVWMCWVSIHYNTMGRGSHFFFPLLPTFITPFHFSLPLQTKMEGQGKQHTMPSRLLTHGLLICRRKRAVDDRRINILLSSHSKMHVKDLMLLQCLLRCNAELWKTNPDVLFSRTCDLSESLSLALHHLILINLID